MAFVLNVNYFPQPVLIREMAWSHKTTRHWLKMVYAEVWIFPANIIQLYLVKVWRCLVLLGYNISSDTIFMRYPTIFVRTASKAPDKLQCDCSETGWDGNKANHNKSLTMWIFLWKYCMFVTYQKYAGFASVPQWPYQCLHEACFHGLLKHWGRDKMAAISQTTI